MRTVERPVSPGILVLLCLLSIVSLMIGCGPSRLRVELKEALDEHKRYCEQWRASHDDLYAKLLKYEENSNTFRRSLSNSQIDKMQKCEKYRNDESCNDFGESIGPHGKSVYDHLQIERDVLRLRYNGLLEWKDELITHERKLNDFAARERASRAAMAQAIGAWGISNQLMLMNNTLNSMHGTMMFNRPMR